MRKPPRTRLARTTRRMLAASAFAALFTGFACTGSASASTVLSSGCTGNVVGNMGDQVAVQGKDVAGLVKTAAEDQQQLLSGVNPDELAQEITDKGALVVGTVPTAANTSITGHSVGAVVRDALQDADGLGSWSDQQRQGTLAAIENEVTGNCGMTAFASNYTQTTNVPGSQPNGTIAPTAAPGMPLPGTAPRDYGNLPAAVPGYGGAPSDRYPATGPLGTPQSPSGVGTLGSATGQTDVRTAGNANSLAAADTSTDAVRLPTLIAVVALAAASAALVRTWVLRKLS